MMAAVTAYAFTGVRLHAWRPPERRRRHILSMVAMLASAFVIAWLLNHGSFARRLHHLQSQAQVQPTPKGAGTQATGVGGRSARVRWDEVAVVAALIAALAAAALATRGARIPRRPWRDWHDAVSLAVDESIDDLRTE